MLSEEPVHESVACPAAPFADRLPGAVGGVVSGIVALASFEGVLRLPAASSAVTL